MNVKERVVLTPGLEAYKRLRLLHKIMFGALLIALSFGGLLFVIKTSAAGSLTISSVSIDSTGKIFTVNVGNVSGSLSPTVGVSGFSLTVNSTARQFSYGTASGTTLILTPYTPILQGQTIKLAYTPGNLVDSGSNTMPVTSNVAVTNNSTLTNVTTGYSIPTGSLDTWKTARQNSASQRVETVVFGDSTTSDSGGNYSFVYELANLASESGYTYGGRGMCDSTADTALRSGPLENLSCVQSQSGFTSGSDSFDFFSTSMPDKTAVGHPIGQNVDILF